MLSGECAILSATCQDPYSDFIVKHYHALRPYFATTRNGDVTPNMIENDAMRTGSPWSTTALQENTDKPGIFPGGRMTINIVLVEPQIPQNTGNVARTCAATGARLHLVGPMGFTISDKKLKRAGLDYWHLLDISVYGSYREFTEKNNGPMLFFSTKAARNYTQVPYPDGIYILFGREDAGLHEDLLRKNYDRCVRLPMLGAARSLNLSNTVAIAVFEALRQNGFPGMQMSGKLTHE